MRRWKIHISFESRALKLSANYVRSLTTQVLAHLDAEIIPAHIKELNILFVNDEKMREINLEFRNKDKTTDVLSFPQFEREEITGKRGVEDPSNSYLGDLVISTETTLSQAKKFDTTKETEVLRLITHGILHLCGYDHENVPQVDAQRMRRKERRIRDQIEV